MTVRYGSHAYQLFWHLFKYAPAALVVLPLDGVLSVFSRRVWKHLVARTLEAALEGGVIEHAIPTAIFWLEDMCDPRQGSVAPRARENEAHYT